MSLGPMLLAQLRDCALSVLSGVSMFCAFLWLELQVAKRRKRPYVAPRELATDWRYWLTSATFRLFSRAGALCGLTGLAFVFGRDLLPAWLHGYGPVARQPPALIMIELVLLADFASYWSHRMMHRVPALWRIHAVHHSSTAVHWHTTVRMHPLNDFITYFGNVVPALALGFPVEALAPLVPLIALYAVYSHSDFDFAHGPFAALLTSPRFHRWHHTAVEDGGDKNFSGVFSLWDRLFGTYYMPQDRLPERFGVDAPDMPEDFWQQLAYPFRRS